MKFILPRKKMPSNGMWHNITVMFTIWTG